MRNFFQQKFAKYIKNNSLIQLTKDEDFIIQSAELDID